MPWPYTRATATCSGTGRQSTEDCLTNLPRRSFAHYPVQVAPNARTGQAGGMGLRTDPAAGARVVAAGTAAAQNSQVRNAAE